MYARRDIDFIQCVVTDPGDSGWNIGDVKHPEAVHEMNSELRVFGGGREVVTKDYRVVDGLMFYGELTHEQAAVTHCEGCQKVHYDGDMVCHDYHFLTGSSPDPGDHCVDYYECDPCCYCGSHPLVLFGPVLGGNQ